MEYKRVWAEIDLDCLASNLHAVRSRMPADARLMAVVKADGYGHGAVETAKRLLYGGADALGVAICEEGVQLRENHIPAPVLVMGFTPEPLLDEVVRHNLIQTLFSAETALALSKAALRRGTRAEVHIKIDTGMSRLGFMPEQASVEKIIEIASLPGLNVSGIYTHFATSDALENGYMHEQRKRFEWLLAQLGERGLRIPVRHMGNSGAFAQTQRGEDYADTGFFMDMIRVGILLYGLLPSSDMAQVCAPLGLKPVMRLMTQVSMVKRISSGAGVGYGHMFHAERETLVATLPVGYADGYARRLSNRARVLVNGYYAPIIGAICMDQCMADVTDIPVVKPGDEVVMLGAQGQNAVTADELADIIGTIGYEIVCGVGKRVPRVYVKNNAAPKTLLLN